MAIPARLTRVLQDVLGEEGGDDLVNWMVHMDANRSELRDLMDAWNGRTDSRFGEADGRMELQFAELREAMDAMEVRLDRRLNDCVNNLLKWWFVLWCGTVAAAALAFGLK
jgi:hypothetical protein